MLNESLKLQPLFQSLIYGLITLCRIYCGKAKYLLHEFYSKYPIASLARSAQPSLLSRENMKVCSILAIA
jgi:hypothetical protein